MAEVIANGAIPLHPEDLLGMANKEFYIGLVDSDKLRTIMSKDGILSKENEAYVDGVAWGTINEIVVRKPGFISTFHWGRIRKVEYEDGSRIEMKGEMGDNYLFTLEEAEIPENSPPIFKGTARHHRVRTNESGPELEKRLVLYLKTMPHQRYDFSEKEEEDSPTSRLMNEIFARIIGGYLV